MNYRDTFRLKLTLRTCNGAQASGTASVARLTIGGAIQARLDNSARA